LLNLLASHRVWGDACWLNDKKIHWHFEQAYEKGFKELSNGVRITTLLKTSPDVFGVYTG